MGYIIYPIRDLLEATFTIIPPLGMKMDIALCVVGGIACTIWIGLMLKYEKQEVSNR